MHFLLVGAGLAGSSFARIAESNGHTFHLISDDSYSASETAAGVYNPVILKRFSPVADAQVHLEKALPFFESPYLHALPVWRRLFSVEEQNNWFIAADKPGLQGFLSTNLIKKEVVGVPAPYGFGEVLHTGYLDTKGYLATCREQWFQKGCMEVKHFDHSRLTIIDSGIQYDNKTYDYVVFAEGVGVQKNPYFSYLPLVPAKGEVLTLRIPGLASEAILKAGVFVLPLGEDLFKVGATYNWTDQDELPTEAGKQEILSNLKELTDLPFEIVAHDAGLRPTVKDRRPLLGIHPNYARVACLNGLGTRGVMLAPTCAEILFNHLVEQTPIPNGYDLRRFSVASCSDRNEQKY